MQCVLRSSPPLLQDSDSDSDVSQPVSKKRKQHVASDEEDSSGNYSFALPAHMRKKPLL